MKRSQPSIKPAKTTSKSSKSSVSQPSIALQTPAPIPRPRNTTTNRNNLPPAQRPLTPRMKAFANTMLANPGMSATQAYLKAYGNKSVKGASVQASRTLAKPSVYAYMSKFEQAAQDRIAGLVLQTRDERLAFDASRDLLDRLHGKATQRTEATSQVVNINLDLTSADE